MNLNTISFFALVGEAKKLGHFRFNKPGKAEQKQKISIGVSKTIEILIKPWTWVISMGVSKPSNPTKAFEVGDCS
jgi:hypothetical protein